MYKYFITTMLQLKFKVKGIQQLKKIHRNQKPIKNQLFHSLISEHIICKYIKNSLGTIHFWGNV